MKTRPTKDVMTKLFSHRERFGVRFEFDRLDWSACGDWYMIDGLDLPEDVEMTDC